MSDISIQVLPVPTKSEDIEVYRNYALEWKRNGRLEICKEMKAAGMAQKLKQEMAQAVRQFREQTPGCSESMELNFVVKLLFWIDMAAAPVLRAAGGRIYYSGPEKKQEKLFFAMLERSGIVIIRGEMPAPMRVDVRRPERDARTKLSQSRPQNPPQNQPQGQPKNFSRTEIRSELRQELSYEKLAQLASSVVKIIVCDSGGRELGCGSGIMISRDGYILTNHHVVVRGSRYGVRIEEDNNIYETDEMVKYNQFLDLAIIRIDRQLTPLTLYQGGQPLVRGQKVVAIGSPLGLFNTVSDGIISGFRQMDHVNMIQFTAPTSHGSSGGALLNMYGELIGISSAGFDQGQNLNLAVDYTEIGKFVQGIYQKI